MVGGDLSARDYKRLIQAGNADWVAESGATQEILDIVARVGAARTGAANQSIVVSFLPSAGGVGNSTLAIETAIQLVRRKPAKDGKVALVDLDFQTSHVCDYLDVAPKFRIEEIIDEPKRLDDRLLEVFASRHSSGLDVFAAARNPLHGRDLGVEALSALFERMAQHYAFIVVDLPVSAHVWTIPLLIASEGILVTGVNTIPGLRQVAETVQRRAGGSRGQRGRPHRRQPVRVRAVRPHRAEPIMSPASSARSSGSTSGTPASPSSA